MSSPSNQAAAAPMPPVQAKPVPAEKASATLDAVKALAPEIAAAAAEGEERRALLPEIVEKLKQAGIFRMLVPKQYGGDELTVTQATAVIQELAKADGAAAWTAMVAYGFNVSACKYPKEVVDKLFANGPDLMVRGALAPIGKAVETEGGYILSGQWPFASGPYKPDWMVAGAIVIRDGKPVMGPMGPETIVAIISPEKVKMLDTWYSVGICASDSTDYSIENEFVEASHTTNLFNFMSPQCYGLPLFDLPFPMLTTSTHSAVSIGLAEASIEEVLELSKTKRAAFDPSQTLGENQVFQHEVGKLCARLDSLQALMDQQTAAVDADQAYQFDPVGLSKNMAWASYMHVQAFEIINELFSLAGSAPCYKQKSTLQRRWRDARVAAQHMAASPSNYDKYGAILAGHMPGPPGAK